MGNFSRDTFDKLKHYVGVRLQQGVPIIDADWNEKEDIRKFELRNFLKCYIGDGVPKGNVGFLIMPLSGTTNDFIIGGGTQNNPGRCLVDGWDVINEHDTKYTNQALNDVNLANEWNVPPLQPLVPPSSGERTDIVYLDVWEREVDAQEDNDLVNSSIGIETCIRLKREWVVRIAVNLDNKDNLLIHLSDGGLLLEGHVYYPLATLHHKADPTAYTRITDLRRKGLAVLSEEITIKDGKVGIGTDNPQGILDVFQAFQYLVETTRDHLVIMEDKEAGKKGKLHLYRTRIIPIPGNEPKTFTEFIVTYDGNVGIGTSTPQNKFDVAGNAVIGSGYSSTHTAPANGLLVEGNVGMGADAKQDSKLHVKGALEQIYGIYTEAPINTDTFTYGIYSIAKNSTSSHNYGISGVAEGSKGLKTGVLGRAMGDSGNNYGVRGEATAIGNGDDPQYGVCGIASGNRGNIYGVWGASTGDGDGDYKCGVYGSSSGDGGNKYGVYGIAKGKVTDNIAVYGRAEGNEENDKYSLYGIAEGNKGTKYGLWCKAKGNEGRKYGVVAKATGVGGENYGVYASATGAGTNYAGYFVGNVHITGNLSKAQGSFLIDHPQDPINKTLRHNFVESPENLCIYRGKIKLNSKGEATVKMPSYFAALTKENEATVTLTAIGKKPFMTSYHWNKTFTSFKVFGEKNAEVSYMVLADRDDPVARQLSRPTEEEKGNGNFEKGKLLYPEAFGHPKEKGIHYEMELESELDIESLKIPGAPGVPEVPDVQDVQEVPKVPKIPDDTDDTE